ncbi:MAG: InlB B-repeat-containing protein [Treponema sp.]|nr:InlB B-repeat-containing protein [Treponema sp.]
MAGKSDISDINVRGAYTVTFDQNGGNGSSQAISVVPPAATVTIWPLTPGQEGHVFTGWNTRADGSGTDFTAATTVNSNITVYAQWMEVPESSWIVIFDPRGWGYFSSEAVSNGGKATEPPNVPRPGYGFGGWFMENGSGTDTRWNFDSDTVTAHISLYALWEPITYTVNYNSNSNNGTGTVAPTSHSYGVFGNLADNSFTRSGYVFLSWNTQPGGGGTVYAAGQQVLDLSNTAGATVQLYAQWLQIPGNGTPSDYYVLYFNSMGGISVPPQVFFDSDPKPAANPGALPNLPDGSTFIRWHQSGSPGTAFIFGTNITRDMTTDGRMTLYALWNPPAPPDPGTYTVTYNPNGGGGSNATVAYDRDAQVLLLQHNNTSLNITPPTANHSFVAWGTNNSGTGTRYAAGQGVMNLAAKDGNINLFALWEQPPDPPKYTVSFVTNGAGTISSQEITVNQTAAEPTPPPTKTGFDFKGWYADPAFSGQPWNFSSNTVTGHLILYALWDIVDQGDGENTPLLVYDIETLNRVGKGTGYFSNWNMKAHYQQIANITLQNLPGGQDNFTPIGTEDNRFEGTYEGNRNYVENLRINSTGAATGLFGVIGQDGTVSRLGLVGLDVTGSSNTGGLAGINRGTIENCYASGTQVIGAGQTGGLVGSNESGATIIESYSIITRVRHLTENEIIGGLVGRNQGSITNSYAAVNEVIGLRQVGGLVGWNQGTINRTYATAAVTATGSGSPTLGGLVGNNNNGTITNSVALNPRLDATGSSTSGGIGRVIGGTTGTYEYNFGRRMNITHTDSNLFNNYIATEALQVAHDGKHGQNIPGESAWSLGSVIMSLLGQDWWSGSPTNMFNRGPGFNISENGSTIWLSNDDRLPTLRNTGPTVHQNPQALD